MADVDSTTAPANRAADKSKVIVFGEILWDLFPEGPRLGGAPCNLAYRLHSLGQSPIFISRLGRDEYGERAIKRLSETGMNLDRVQRDDKRPTGTVRVNVDARGNPDFLIVPDVAYDAIEFPKDGIEKESVSCFCFGTLIQRSEASRKTLHQMLNAFPRATKFLDLNLRKDCYTKETVSESLKRADILKLNENEVRELSDMFDLDTSGLETFSKQTLRQWDLTHLLITLGEYGTFAASANGEMIYDGGHKVGVVDTCGSGDACSAGFLHSLLCGKSLQECCAVGNALGAPVATQAGATEPIPLENLNHFCKESQSHPRNSRSAVRAGW